MSVEAADWSVTPQRFRHHRGSLAESLETVVEVTSRDALVAHLTTTYPFAPVPNFSLIKVESYSGDDRRCSPVWRDTHIVSLPGYGVLGFCEGPL